MRRWVCGELRGYSAEKEIGKKKYLSVEAEVGLRLVELDAVAVGHRDAVGVTEGVQPFLQELAHGMVGLASARGGDALEVDQRPLLRGFGLVHGPFDGGDAPCPDLREDLDQELGAVSRRDHLGGLCDDDGVLRVGSVLCE